MPELWDSAEIREAHYTLWLAIRHSLRPEQAHAKLHGEPEPLPTNEDIDDMRVMRRNGIRYCEIAQMYCADAGMLKRMVKHRSTYFAHAKWAAAHKERVDEINAASEHRRKGMRATKSRADMTPDERERHRAYQRAYETKHKAERNEKRRANSARYREEKRI